MKPTDISSKTRWVALSLLPSVGTRTLDALLRRFDGDLEAALAAESHVLRGLPGIGGKTARDIKGVDLAAAADDMAEWERLGLQILSREDEGYPAQLREASDHPPTVFLRGCMEQLARERTVAIVGTRSPSRVAKMLTLQLAMKLARADCVVVSGMALGIDSAAQASAIEAGGMTVAVLGSGLLNIYPPQNRGLARRIVGSGALISELHPRVSANAQRLVARNRVISGLSSALIVVESSVDGGAMHAARFAREQDRRVFTFALPASGNQQLIRQGAAVLPSDLDAALGYLLR